MVKRQTVWLSTMMVLSLMLIGYYTLGTPPTQSTKGAAGVRGSSNVAVGVSGSVPASATGGVQTGVTSQQPSDWFLQMSMGQNKASQAVIQTLQATIGDQRASNQAVSKAYEELTAIQTQEASATRVHDLLLGYNYPDSLVLFNKNGDVHVYVEASTLQPADAVQIINLVSSTLGVQSNHVIVTPHQ